MAARRTLLLTMALGAALLGAWPAVPVGAQAPEVPPTTIDPGTTAPVAIEPVTEPAADPAVTAAPEPEPAGPTSRPLFTESRKILAIIAGLVLVALALALLTVRYWRITKPVPAPMGGSSDDAAPSPAVPAALDPADFDPAEAPLFVGDLDPPLAPITTEVPSVAAADHRPDATWEPRGTGEHAAIQVAAAASTAGASTPASSPASIARPGRAARRAALAVAAPVGDGPGTSTSPVDPEGTDAAR